MCEPIKVPHLSFAFLSQEIRSLPHVLLPESLLYPVIAMDHSQPPVGPATRVSALCKWYLQKLSPDADQLRRQGDILHIPDNLPNDTIYLALFLYRRYYPYRERALPLKISFYLALVKATQMTRPKNIIDFGVYGFPDAQKQPRECIHHGMPFVANAQEIRQAFPSTTLKCGPHVCKSGMLTLYDAFAKMVDIRGWVKNINTFNAFRKELLGLEYGAKICTEYLKTLDFGSKAGILSTPFELVQAFSYRQKIPFSLRSYYAALFLLRKYRDSANFDASALADIDLCSVFYATVAIALPMFYENEHTTKARTLFIHLGFPQPKDTVGNGNGSANGMACEHHSALQDTRREEEDRWTEKGSGMTKREWTRMTVGITEFLMMKHGMEIEIAPGMPMGRGARQYMGCDEGVVCADGMVRLMDYLLAYAFKWDVNIHLNGESSEFLKFEVDVAVQFGRETLLGQRAPREGRV